MSPSEKDSKSSVNVPPAVSHSPQTFSVTVEIELELELLEDDVLVLVVEELELDVVLVVEVDVVGVVNGPTVTALIVPSLVYV